MAGETDVKPQGQTVAKKARTRSPAYPYLDLRTALDKTATLWRAEGRHAVAVSLAMQHWGYKAESSTGYSCIAALKKFGLVDEEGTGESRQVRLSRLALAVLLDEDRTSPERNAALQTAALSPRIHAELWEKYGADLPSDSSLRRFLILEKNFNEAAVDEFLEEYKTTVAFAGLRSSEPVTATPGGGGSSPPIEPGSRRVLPPAAPATATTPKAGQQSGAAVQPATAGRKPNPTVPSAVGAGRKKHHAAASPVAVPEPQTGFLFPEVGGRTEPAPAAQGRKFRTGDAASAPALATEPSESAPRELPVPLDNNLVVRVPYPMSEEDFDLLIETLHLWKKRLVRPLD